MILLKNFKLGIVMQLRFFIFVVKALERLSSSEKCQNINI